MRLIVFYIATTLLLVSVRQHSIAGETYTQQPTVAASQVRGEVDATPSEPEASTARKSLDGGPKPTWIWGTDARKRYVLTKEFVGGSTNAWIEATCDNEMTLFVNDKRIASSTEWQQSVEVDIQEHLLPGKNTVRAELDNEGSVGGFACKIALTMPGGDVKYIVSDKDWNAAELTSPDNSVAITTHGQMGVGPWGDVFSKPAGAIAKDRDIFNVPAGFQVELLYTVPKDILGSWVSIAFDNKGRLLASDQGDKGICRITPPAIGSDELTKVERLDLKLTAAHGMLYAFDSLYVSVNGGPGSGLYRARDTNGDDQYDEVVKLKDIRGGGEHGPHALRLSPDGKSIYVIAGNHTDPPFKPGDETEVDSGARSRIRTNWSEDLLLPRQWDARGHARGKLAPGGWIAKTDPDGKTWEIFSIGYRNPYDMAFNADGELFAYDADMEWDMGTPWYRPTRVVHATSGSEFGWRSGTGKWPTYYLDSLPPAVEIGPGSPVGVEFGYGTKFPEKYQKALFICDWTFGTMYAVHLQAKGSSYVGEKEEFVSRTPLPLTDVAVGHDGALYFTVGGRGTQSEVYRVTYVSEEWTTPVNARDTQFAELRKVRKSMESPHGSIGSLYQDPAKVVKRLLEGMGHSDRHIRYAARVAIESFGPPNGPWPTNADATIQLAAASARAWQIFSDREKRQDLVIERLASLDFDNLSERQGLDYLRALSLVFTRLGEPSMAERKDLINKLDANYPAKSDDLNRELCNLLVYLNSPTVATKTLTLIEQPSEQSTKSMDALLARNAGYGGIVAKILSNQVDLQKLHYAFALRNLRYGWTLEQRKQYFSWLAEARTKSGGASYEGFIDNIRKDALANASESERKAIESEVAIALPKPTELPKAEGPGHDWQLAELVELTSDGLAKRDFEHGKKMFAAARCIICHRFDGSGGATGPDLSNVAGRFSFKDLSEAIVDPSKVISDQYRASVVVTTKGQVHAGRLSGEQIGTLTVLTDPEDISKFVDVPADEVDEVTPSKVSLMPKDLLKTLNETEVLDLLAYLQSRGNPNDAMFAK